MKRRVKQKAWRGKRLVAVIVLMIIFVLVVGAFLYELIRPRTLEVSVSPTVTYGGTIRITIKNISNKDVTFSNSGFDLFFERREGFWPFFTWRHVADFSPSLPESRVLKSGENITLPYIIDKTWNPSFSESGRYRVGTHGVYAEFTLEWKD
jgi:hypothetical protein